MALLLSTSSVVVVTTAGTRVPLSLEARPLPSIVIQGNVTNKRNIYLGDSTVTRTNGIAIGPGETVEITGSEAGSATEELIFSDLYIDADVSGESVRIAFFKRKPG